MPSPDATAPQRILLNVKSPKSDEEVVKAFLRFAQRSEDEYENNQHYIHLDPNRRGNESWSHIVLDMNARKVSTSNLDDILLEIYKAKSEDPRDEM